MKLDRRRLRKSLSFIDILPRARPGGELLGNCFWRAAPGAVVGPDRPAARSLGEDWRAVSGG